MLNYVRSIRHNTSKTLAYYVRQLCRVRYTYALRGEPKITEDGIRIEEEEVNIMIGEQLTEHFLCDINAAGEVCISS